MRPADLEGAFAAFTLSEVVGARWRELLDARLRARSQDLVDALFLSAEVRVYKRAASWRKSTRACVGRDSGNGG
jgi:hypothetical protein